MLLPPAAMLADVLDVSTWAGAEETKLKLIPRRTQ
jgi:hypothetical protein